MTKKLLRRSLSMLLTLIMVCGLFPSSVFAADLPVEVNGLELAGFIVGNEEYSLKATATNSCDSVTEATASGTLTNVAGNAGTLIFDYKITCADGAAVKIDGESYSGTGTFSKPVAVGGEIKITLTSGITAEGNSAEIVITKPRMEVNIDITTTFLPTENGSYTVDGNAVTETYSHTKNATETTALKATPAAGYMFLGWYSQEAGKYVSMDAEWTTYLTNVQTIEARFAPKDAPVFQVGTDFRSADLNEAITFANTKGPKTVVLIQDGTLPAGTYTVPSGVTLLIPFDEAGTLYTNAPEGIGGGSWVKPTVYRKLTMAAGAALTVENGGAISVGSKFASQNAGAGNKSAAPTGAYGQIDMEQGSSITLESNAVLYAWGYITGDGTISAQNGSSVYEYFQISDFRGGSATLALYNARSQKKIFPFSQYYIQNVEVPVTFEAGAMEYGYTGLYAGGSLTTATLPFIGTSGALFNLTSGTLEKDYDPASDRLIVTVNDTMSVDKITVKAMGKIIQSSEFVLPINSNISLNVAGGTTTLLNDTSFLPGVKVSIDEGAALRVAETAKLYVYDRDEWVGKQYTVNADLYPAAYSPTQGRKVRTSADLEDAEIQVSGTLTVDGALYTTAGGANISGTAPGTVKFASGASADAQLYELIRNQYTGSTFSAKIEDKHVGTSSVTSAQLKNAAEDVNPYSVTTGAAAGDTFYYHDGMWDNRDAEAGEHHPHVVAVDEKVDPTCTKTGLTEGSHCAVCGKVLVPQTEIGMIEHAWGEGKVTKPATCIAQGEQEFTCTAEGCTATKTEPIPLTDHTWDAGKVTTAPTCSAAGVRTYTCTVEGCGKTKTEAVDPIAHTEETDARVEPTCVADGKTEGSHCKVCGTVLVKQEPISALGHEYGPVTWEETETASGGKAAAATVMCQRTGCTEQTKGHSLTASGDAKTETTEATCTEAGQHSYTVTVTLNGKEETHTWTETIPAKGHEPEEIPAQAPTCTEGGFEAGEKCKVCGEVLKARNPVPALGHDLKRHEAKAPTCTEIGWEAYETCARCDHTTYKERAALGHAFATAHDASGHWEQCTRCEAAGEKQPHTWDDGEVTKAATCTEEGIRTYGCACSETKTEPIEALGHDWSAWEVTMPATCVAKGEEARGCTRTGCDAAETREIEIDPKHHADVVTDAAVPASCTETGLTEGRHCAACKTVLEAQQTVEKLPHTEQTVPGTAATCTKTGLTDGTKCAVCGTVLKAQEVIEMTDHTPGEAQKEHVVGATCTTPGRYEEVVSCTACGKELSRTEKTVEALGHDLEQHEAKAPTCTEEGWNAYETCTRCDHTTYQAVPAPGHTWSEAWNTDANGHWHVCTVCGGKDTAAAHDWNKGEVTRKAACTQSGEMTYTCTLCGRTKTEEIPATGHTAEVLPAVAPTCTKTGLTAGEKCAVCGTVLKAQQSVSMLPHSLTATAAQAPTCTKDGNYAYWTCRVCKQIFNDAAGENPIELKDTVIKAGHSWSDWTVTTAATCLAPGEETRTCAGCGAAQTRPIGQLQHRLDYVAERAAACEETGNIAHYRCGDCGHFFADDRGTQELLSVTTPALTHRWGAWTVSTEPGCVTEGEQTRTCERDETHVDTRSVPALGHSYGEPSWDWKQVKTDAGETVWTVSAVFTCTRCGDEVTVENDEIDVQCEKTEATCTGEGVEVYTATLKFRPTADGEEQTYTKVMSDVVDPATGHSYSPEQEAAVWSWRKDETGAWVVSATLTCTQCGVELSVGGNAVTITDEVTAPPTCEAEGVRTYTARTVVGAETYYAEETEPIAALGHAIVTHPAKAATCAAPGYDAYETCARCAYSTWGDEIPALGHDWNEGEVTSDPTCTAEGVKTYTCLREGCGETRTEAVEMLAHRTRLIAAEAPTCTADGWKAYYMCADCGELFLDEAGTQKTTLAEQRIPATGHDYAPETVEFIWTQNDRGGYTATAAIACACGEKLPAVNAGITFTDVPATCEADGTRTFTAAAVLDGAEYTDTNTVTLEKLGHTFVPAWTWREDHSGATVTLTCSRNGCGAVRTGEASVTSETRGNTTTYTARVSLEGMVYTDGKTVTVTPPIGGGGSIGGGGAVAGGTTEIKEQDVPLADVLPFEDVSDGFWGRDDIAAVYHKGLMMGLDDGTVFAPHMSTTRAMIVTILYRAEKGAVTAENMFNDVNASSWYSEAVTWGTANQVIAGYGNGMFGPDDEITREQLVAILWRNLGRPAARNTALPFSDAGQVSDYARTAMQWALEQGIIHGKSDTVLDPKGHATRAETAAILNRYLELTAEK